MNAPEAWQVEATQGGKDIVVAVIDDGVGFSHPDLKDRAWKNPGESGGVKETNGVDDDSNGFVDDVYGWDFHNDNNTVYDSLDNHGTHVAGTIAASVNGEGVVGVAPNVEIMAVKFMDPGVSDGVSTGTTEDAIKAIGYAKKMGAKISNNSWGGDLYNSLLKEAIDESEMLFVAAAGNNNLNNDGSNPHYPASYKPEKDGDPDNILSVAAIENQGKRAGFSNYGANSVDISAPGVSTLSSYPAAPEWPGVALSTVGSSGKAVVTGFGVEEITNTASQSAADARGSFMKRAFEAVGRGNQQVILVDDDASRVTTTPSPFGFPDVQPALKDAIQKATGTAPQVVDVPYGFSIATSSWSQFQGKTIVWSTGHAWLTFRFPGTNSIFTALSPTDQQNLTNFLNGGGKLILTGRDALFLIEGKPFTFVDKTLGLDVMRDVKSTRFNGNVSLTAINGAAGTRFEGESYALTNEQTTLGRSASVRHDFVIPEEAKTEGQGSYNVSATPATWKYLDGTSMAAPHATGAAVLAASISPALLKDPEALKKAVLDGGKPAPETKGMTLTEDMVDARAVLTKADKTAPQLSLPGEGDPKTITEKATRKDGVVGAVVSFTATAKDNVDGDVPVSCASASGLKSGDTFPVGTTEVTCSAKDKAGNEATGKFNVEVIYDFKGFFSPVDNPDTLNKAKAGSAIPVKFTLGGDMGLDVFYKEGDSTYPRSADTTCGSTETVDVIEETVTANSSGLSFDETTGQYTYVWKTSKNWANTCRQLVVKLKDGRTYRAYFQLS